jgi:SpoIIAA-like
VNRDGMNSVNKVDLKGKGTMELSGGVLCLRWKRGAYIGIDVAKAAIAAISALGNGSRLPMLVEIQGVTHSAAARKVFPDASSVSRMALLGSSPVDRVIAMFRLPLLPTGFPIRYFTSEDKAQAWLLESSGEAEATHSNH